MNQLHQQKVSVFQNDTEKQNSKILWKKSHQYLTKDQKAGKRFFCQICMINNIEIGYTKRFDLTKHLTRCGKEGVEKPFKCTGYGACEKSFARVEN